MTTPNHAATAPGGAVDPVEPPPVHLDFNSPEVQRAGARLILGLGMAQNGAETLRFLLRGHRRTCPVRKRCPCETCGHKDRYCDSCRLLWIISSLCGRLCEYSLEEYALKADTALSSCLGRTERRRLARSLNRILAAERRRREFHPDTKEVES